MYSALALRPANGWPDTSFQGQLQCPGYKPQKSIRIDMNCTGQIVSCLPRAQLDDTNLASPSLSHMFPHNSLTRATSTFSCLVYIQYLNSARQTTTLFLCLQPVYTVQLKWQLHLTSHCLKFTLHNKWNTLLC